MGAEEKPLKRHGKTIILGGVLLVLVTAYIFRGKLEPIESSRFVYTLGGKAITAVSIRNPKGSVEFVKVDAAWTMIAPASYRVDPQKLSIIEGFLTRLPFRRVMKEGRGDEARFGLDRPEIAVRFTLSDGTNRELLIGNLTAGMTQRYARDPSRPFVFLLDIGSVSQFEGTVSSYRVKDIYDIDIAGLDRIRLRTPVALVIELTRENDEWRISSPFRAAVNNVAMNKVMVTLRGLKAVDYLPEPAPDLGKLGLAPFTLSLGLRDTNGRQQTLEFGGTDGSGFLFMRRGSGADIVRLLASDIDFHDFEPSTLIGEAPFRESIEHVRRFTIEDGGTTSVFNVDSTSQPPSYKYGDAPVNGSDFVALYVRCINLVAVGYDPRTPAGAPVMTLTSEMKDGTRKSLALYVRDRETYSMKADGGVVQFYAAADQVELIRTRLKKVIAGAG